MISYEKITRYNNNKEGVKFMVVIIIISKIILIINHMFVINVMIYQ